MGVIIFKKFFSIRLTFFFDLIILLLSNFYLIKNFFGGFLLWLFIRVL